MNEQSHLEDMCGQIFHWSLDMSAEACLVTRMQREGSPHRALWPDQLDWSAHHPISQPNPFKVQLTSLAKGRKLDKSLLAATLPPAPSHRTPSLNFASDPLVNLLLCGGSVCILFLIKLSDFTHCCPWNSFLEFGRQRTRGPWLAEAAVSMNVWHLCPWVKPAWDENIPHHIHRPPTVLVLPGCSDLSTEFFPTYCRGEKCARLPGVL